MIKEVSEEAVKVTSKFLPQILTGFGLSFCFGSVILAWHNGKVANERISRRKEIEQVDKLTVGQTISEIWPEVLGVGISFAAGATGIIGGQIISGKRLSAVSTALALTEKSFEQYKQSVKETVGNAKNDKINVEDAKKSIEQNPLSEASIVEHSDFGGTTLCYDKLTGRYFYSDIDTLKKGECTIIKRLLNEMYISWNEWYNEIGLAGIDIGNELGFNSDYAPFKINYSSILVDERIPCICISYDIMPRYDYRNLH